MARRRGQLAGPADGRRGLAEVTSELTRLKGMVGAGIYQIGRLLVANSKRIFEFGQASTSRTGSRFQDVRASW